MSDRNGTQGDHHANAREITPKLDGFSLSAIAQATGLSLAACSRFRAGTRVPHRRHWPASVALAKRGRGPRNMGGNSSLGLYVTLT